jgi:hypothetical protein
MGCDQGESESGDTNGEPQRSDGVREGVRTRSAPILVGVTSAAVVFIMRRTSQCLPTRPVLMWRSMEDLCALDRDSREG